MKNSWRLYLLKSTSLNYTKEYYDRHLRQKRWPNGYLDDGAAGAIARIRLHQMHRRQPAAA
ncbi:hypothetical protein QPX96_10725 [Limosilactobacillus fermentum]|nr:hypothetical protein [Limosilactobacillus fermentum]